MFDIVSSDADLRSSNANLHSDLSRPSTSTTTPASSSINLHTLVGGAGTNSMTASITSSGTTNASTLTSAESIALSLLRQFPHKALPAASELDWLVSEKDAPQQLLPLPASQPISPDDAAVKGLKQPVSTCPIEEGHIEQLRKLAINMKVGSKVRVLSQAPIDSLCSPDFTITFLV